MFINKKGFKNLCKEAYKTNGLTVGCVKDAHDNSWYMIKGGYWRILVEDEFFPKEAKAAVIELTGELPGIDECFNAIKGEPNQYEFDSMTYEEMKDIIESSKKEFTVTHLIEQGVEKNTRFLQAECGTLLGINDVFTRVMDHRAIEWSKGEHAQKGPCAHSGKSIWVVWYNNVCFLQVWVRKPSEEADQSLQMWEDLKEICLY